MNFYFMSTASKQEKKARRKKRTKAKIFGTMTRPRLSVYRSLKHIYAQLIDDEKGKTLIAASDLEFRKSKTFKKKTGQKSRTQARKKEQAEKTEKMRGKTAIAYEVGKLIAEKAAKKQIKKVVFDRGSFLYHGRVKALAEGARAGGLEF